MYVYLAQCVLWFTVMAHIYVYIQYSTVYSALQTKFTVGRNYFVYSHSCMLIKTKGSISLNIKAQRGATVFIAGPQQGQSSTSYIVPPFSDHQSLHCQNNIFININHNCFNRYTISAHICTFKRFLALLPPITRNQVSFGKFNSFSFFNKPL